MLNTAIIPCERSVFPKGGNTAESKFKVLLSRYIIIDILKSGNDTTVYLVKHPTIEQKLIIKQLRITDLSTVLFNREVQILKHLKSPYIPLLYDIQKDNDYYYIIEEYITGKSLKSIVDKSCLSVDTAIRYTIRLCDILKYLHGHSAGTILYLDCRPDNIIISADDTVHLIDFGNSNFKKDTPDRSFCCGSVGYAPPELYKPHTQLTCEADIYGVGALLYYMLTGSPSLRDFNLHKRKIPKKLISIIKKCLHHLPCMRYRSIDALKDALEKLCAHHKKTLKSENISLTISIAGSERRVGVTHLGISLAQYLNKQGYYSLFKCMDTHSIFSRLESTNHNGLSFDAAHGTYLYKGLALLPSCNETIDLDVSDIISTSDSPTVIINDFGVLTSENADAFNASDVCLLAGSGKAWEFGALLGTGQLCNLDKTFFIVNFVNGTDFYHLIKGQSNRFIRMPYYYNMHSPGASGTQFLEELTDEIKKRWKE